MRENQFNANQKYTDFPYITVELTILSIIYIICCLTKRKKVYLDLTKQRCKSFPLENDCSDTFVSAGNKLFSPNWGSEKLLFLLNNHPVTVEKMWLFQKGQTIGLHQASKTNKEHCWSYWNWFKNWATLLKAWRKGMNQHLWWRNVVRGKSLRLGMRDHLNAYWDKYF